MEVIHGALPPDGEMHDHEMPGNLDAQEELTEEMLIGYLNGLSPEQQARYVQKLQDLRNSTLESGSH